MIPSRRYEPVTACWRNRGCFLEERGLPICTGQCSLIHAKNHGHLMDQIERAASEGHRACGEVVRAIAEGISEEARVAEERLADLISALTPSQRGRMLPPDPDQAGPRRGDG